MKSYLKVSWLVAAMAGGGWAEDAPAVPMRDAVTHDELAAKLRGVQQVDPMLKMAPAKGADPAKASPPPNLLSQSDIVCFGGRATLVPKQAILHLPPNLAERLKFQAGARIQSWAEFYTENRGWIITMEVSRVQAEGRQALDEETCKRLNNSPNLVVATFQGGPISVLPPKVEPPADTPEIPTQPASSKPAQPVTPKP